MVTGRAGCGPRTASAGGCAELMSTQPPAVLAIAVLAIAVLAIAVLAISF